MRLLAIISIILGCYACADTTLKHGETEKAGDTTNNPNEADVRADPAGTTSALLASEPGGIFKSFADAGRGKGDAQKEETWKGVFMANKKPRDQEIKYGSTTASEHIIMESTARDEDHEASTSSLSIIKQRFTQTGQDANITRPTATTLYGNERKGKLDLLIVLDNSNSMLQEIGVIKNNLRKLIPNIENTDWKILVMISESKGSNWRSECNRIATSEAQFKRILSNIDLNSNVWKENVPWQVRKGLANCKGLKTSPSVYWPLNKNKRNKRNSWMRNDSTLAVLVITDEDFQCSRCNPSNCSITDPNEGRQCKEYARDAVPERKCHSYHCGDSSGMKREFEAYRNSSNRRAFYGIINKSNKRCGDQIRNSNGKRYNDPEQWYHKGRKMVWSSGNRRYNGPTNPCYMRDDNRRIFWQNIYELDSGGFFDKLLDIESNNGQIQALLTDIGKDITGRLESKFDLGRNNASYTIKSVTVAGNNRTNYEKEGRYLIFTGNQLPKDDQQIIVRYNDSSDGAQRSYDRTFSLDHRPDPDTVKVKVDDNSLQKNGNWRVSGNTIELLATTDDMIKQITPSGARIVVEYKRRPEDVAKERVFNLPNNNRYIPPSSVQVAKGCGRNYTGSGFSINGRTVTFDSGNEPDHGQRVCFRYNEVTNTYQYSFPVVQGATGFSCAKGGIAVSCQYNSGQILFTNANQFSADVNGTEVDVSYTKPQDSAFVAALDERCVKDSVTLSSGSITCDSGQLVFNGNELDLAQADTQKCSFLKNPTIDQQMFLSCRADDQTFIIDDPELKIRRGDYKIEVWEVTNNGQPMTESEFTIDENDYTLSFIDEHGNAKDLGDNREIAVTINFMN